MGAVPAVVHEWCHPCGWVACSVIERLSDLALGASAWGLLRMEVVHLLCPPD